MSCRQDYEKQSARRLIQDSIYQQDIFNKLTNRIKLKDSVYIKILKLNPQDTFNLIHGLDLNNGDLKVFVETNRFIDDSLGQRPGGYYYLDNDSIIKVIFRRIPVIYQHGDCCTPDGNLLIIKNDTQVFATGVLHGAHGGFQESLYGWTIPTDSSLIQKILRSFIFLDKLRPGKTGK